MIKYNLYYKNAKINTSSALSVDEIKEVFSKNFIYKKNALTGRFEKIPVAKLKCVKCIIV